MIIQGIVYSNSKPTTTFWSSMDHILPHVHTYVKFHVYKPLLCKKWLTSNLAIFQETLEICSKYLTYVYDTYNTQ